MRRKYILRNILGVRRKYILHFIFVWAEGERGKISHFLFTSNKRDKIKRCLQTCNKGRKITLYLLLAIGKEESSTLHVQKGGSWDLKLSLCIN